MTFAGVHLRNAPVLVARSGDTASGNSVASDNQVGITMHASRSKDKRMERRKLDDDSISSDSKCEIAESTVALQLAELQFLYTRTSGKYPAQDGFLQLTRRPTRGRSQSRKSTGTYVGIEVKSGGSYVVAARPHEDAVCVKILRKHVDVWRASALPFALCWVDIETKQTYWSNPLDDIEGVHHRESGDVVHLRCIALASERLANWLWRVAQRNFLIDGLDSRTLPTLVRRGLSAVDIKSVKDAARQIRRVWNESPPLALSHDYTPVVFPHRTWKHLTAFSRAPRDVISKLVLLEAAYEAIVKCPARSKWRDGWQIVARIERPGLVATFIRVIFSAGRDNKLALFTVYEVAPDSTMAAKKESGGRLTVY